MLRGIASGTAPVEWVKVNENRYITAIEWTAIEEGAELPTRYAVTRFHDTCYKVERFGIADNTPLDGHSSLIAAQTAALPRIRIEVAQYLLQFDTLERPIYIIKPSGPPGAGFSLQTIRSMADLANIDHRLYQIFTDEAEALREYLHRQRKHIDHVREDMKEAGKRLDELLTVVICVGEKKFTLEPRMIRVLLKNWKKSLDDCAYYSEGTDDYTVLYDSFFLGLTAYRGHRENDDLLHLDEGGRFVSASECGVNKNFLYLTDDGRAVVTQLIARGIDGR